MSEKITLWAGIDVGSTTVKVAIVDPNTRKLQWAKYQRHNARQLDTVKELMREASQKFPATQFRTVFCGSAGHPYAESLEVFFAQEVIANTVAIKEFYPQVRVAIELGGQDAKVIFFRQDDTTGQLVASDMRMNGSCAGGTGAFIDQIAELLNIKTEQFDDFASRGKTVYDISGRCGVFAKTDIQPLLNQGVTREDIALSSLHAIAKQTIGGLAQGMDIVPPIIFEGGPMTFIPTLVRVFKERLNLSDDQAIVPEGAETMIAYGAALANDSVYKEHEGGVLDLKKLEDLTKNMDKVEHSAESMQFFSSIEEQEQFAQRHDYSDFEPPQFAPGTHLEAWLGLDAGSTTSKFVLLNENEEVIYTFYANNDGDPLKVVQEALLKMYQHFEDQGVQLKILGSGSTGYGEILFNKAFKTDYHTVETVSHAEAAQKENPDVSFILDIGGQDMKAISLHNGIVTGIILNEACSAGCGSFIETYSKSLGIPVQDIASLAFQADNPSVLGSRCTVFMNSSIITEQKMGKSESDIMAGLCRSVIENVFTKVVRMSNLAALGETIVVQGGTFRNDAVLRAFEQYVGREVIRPQFAGLMGAIGVALLAKKHIHTHEISESSFLTREQLEQFTFDKQPGMICEFCPNNCNRTLIAFNDGSHFITGNRCEKGEVLGELTDEETRAKIAAIQARQNATPDLFKTHNKLLFKKYPTVATKTPDKIKGMRLGIPRALDYWHTYPFWSTFLRSLGFEVVLSKKSSYDVFEEGLSSVPSDTACLPAKMVHGHIEDLIEKKVDRIFMPMQIARPPEHGDAGTAVCAMLQGYSMVVDKTMEPMLKYGIPVDHPVFHWQTDELREKQLVKWFKSQWNISGKATRQALEVAIAAQKQYRADISQTGKEILASLGNEESEDFAVVLAGRPYHYDPFINHHLSQYFTQMGIPVLTLESLPLDEETMDPIRMETNNVLHTRLILGAQYVSQHPNLEMVQIVSFSCGHDATLTDEMTRILHTRSNKEPLVLKLDEGDVKGPLNIRIKSFIETVKVRRQKEVFVAKNPETFPFRHVFDEKDKENRTVLIPNLSPAFSQLIARLLQNDGYKTYQLPVAERRAIELGKKHVHNDICFPAQINIGEALALLEQGKFEQHEVALGLAKNCENCRAGQYAVLARKALDEAGYSEIPIVTTGSDSKGIHPAFALRMPVRIRLVWGMAMVDAMEHMLRTTRPYELEEGTTDKVFRKHLDLLVEAVGQSPDAGLKALSAAIQEFNTIPVNREVRKPRVGVLGEILVKYHPAGNGNVERYLEAHGMEVVQPPMIDFFRRDELIKMDKVKRGFSSRPFMQALMAGISEQIYKRATKKVERLRKTYRFYEPFPSTKELSETIMGFIDRTYVVGEGWMIPAEIIHQAEDGVNSFVIINPFGCMPNHISGRGMSKALKKMFPHIQILSLDYDPDTSFANAENRLQMLIMGAKELEKV